MAAAPTAIPPKPKIAAIIAITKKITVQRNIKLMFSSMNKGKIHAVKIAAIIFRLPAGWGFFSSLRE